MVALAVETIGPVIVFALPAPTVWKVNLLVGFQLIVKTRLSPK